MRPALALLSRLFSFRGRLSAAQPSSTVRPAPSSAAQRPSPSSSGVFAASVAAGLALATFAPAPAAEARTIIRDAEIERTLKMIARPVYRAAGLNFERVPIFILSDRSLNAFVTGANVMFLNTGMLVELDTPEELMAVIAHEAAHVVERHVVTRLAAQRTAGRASILSTIIGIGAAVAGAGDVGLAGASAGNRIALRDLLSFTRAQEAGADQTGARLMNRAGVDPAAMLSVLRRFENQVAGLQIDPYAQTHPLGRRRILLLESVVARSPARGKKLSREIAYWHARMRAKIDGYYAGVTSSRTRRRFNNPEIDLYRDAMYRAYLPDTAGALKAIDRLIKMRPNDPYYWELKGQILYQSGRGRQAVTPYRRAVKLAPNEPLIAAGLGRSLLTLKTRKANREALRVLERAAVGDPFHSGMRRSLAEAYSALGNDGMAALASAERFALLGRIRDAHIQAKRAQRFLPNGSPGWLRAADVLDLKPRR